MQRPRLSQITLLVLLFPIGWLWYWTSLFDNLEQGPASSLAPILNHDASEMIFGIEHFENFLLRTKRTAAYERVLNLDSGSISTRKLPEAELAIFPIRNKAGTKLNVTFMDAASASPPSQVTTLQYTFASDSSLKSDASLTVNFDINKSTHCLLESDLLVIQTEDSLRVYDLKDQFKVIHELTFPEKLLPGRLKATTLRYTFIAHQGIENPTGVTSFTSIHQITESGIIELARWQNSSANTVMNFESCYIGDQLYALASDASEIQARSLVDGRITSRSPIEKGMQTSRFIFKEENEYGYVNPGMNAPTMLIHWPSGKTHALPSPNASLVHSLSDQGLLLFTEHLAPNRSRLLVTSTDNTTEAIADYALSDYFSVVVDPQKADRIYACGSSWRMNVDVFDVTQEGQLNLVRSYRPLIWLWHYQLALVGFLLLWLYVFQFLFLADRGSYRAYLLSISGLVVSIIAALYFRIFVTGDPMGAYRREYQSLIGLGLAFVACTVLWSVFGQQRVGLRIVAPVAAVALLLTMVYLSMGNKHGALPIMSVALSLFAVTLSIAYGLLRWRGLRLTSEVRMNAEVDMHHASDAEGQANKNLQLRDIFLITAVVACLFSIVRFVEVPAIPQVDKFMISGALLTLSIGVFVPLVAMMRLNQGLKWIFIAVLSIVAVALHVVAVQRVPGRLFATFWTDFQKTGESMLVFAFFYSYVMLGLYRQGLRMLRRPDKGLDRNGLTLA